MANFCLRIFYNFRVKIGKMLLFEIIGVIVALIVILRISCFQTLPLKPQSKEAVVDNFSWPGVTDWTEQSTSFHVLFNYFSAEENFSETETITYTTHSTLEYLWHLEPLSLFWQGPISVAVYSPTDDFQTAINFVSVFRKCGLSSIRRFVTFHLFFPKQETLKEYPKQREDIMECYTIDTKLLLSSHVNQNEGTFKKQLNTPYPINTARNIARISARTTYILASDIELYPSANIIPRFLKLIHTLRIEGKYTDTSRKIFVLPVFEMTKSVRIPRTKNELVKLYRNKQVITFHEFICNKCHRIPNEIKWLNLNVSEETLDVFSETKRNNLRRLWEPIYIGTNNEPLYDERFNWEGANDKMMQMFEMCLMGYDLNILDNAFLVHSPGIKYRYKISTSHLGLLRQQRRLRLQLEKQLRAKYPTKSNC